MKNFVEILLSLNYLALIN